MTALAMHKDEVFIRLGARDGMNIVKMAVLCL
jgi:hypothetical protein